MARKLIRGGEGDELSHRVGAVLDGRADSLNHIQGYEIKRYLYDVPILTVSIFLTVEEDDLLSFKREIHEPNHPGSDRWTGGDKKNEE